MFLLISVVMTGLSLCAVIWAISRPAVLKPFEAGAHGSHPLLHIAWPWVLAFKPMCEPFISWRTRSQLTHQIRLAGLDSAWKPGDVVALQAVVAASCCVLTAISLRTLADLSWHHTLVWAALSGGASAWLPRNSILIMGRRRQQHMLRELPFFLDMMTLCVEAGLNLQGALQRAAQYGPVGPLSNELQYALADMRAGTPRIEAFSKLAERTDLRPVASLVAALTQAELTGSSLGPLLRSQSDQCRSERFLRAEELALKAPVKMLFPMVVCIFPCTFLVIGFPIAVKVLSGAA